MHVDDNDFVEKDQVLVELDNGIGYSNVKKAKAALIRAEATFNYQEEFYARQTALYKSGQLAKNTYEAYTRDYLASKAALLEAQASLEISQQTYDNLFIKAPEAGVIIAKKVNLGQMITAQFQATELFIIAKDLKKMEAEIDVDESDIGLVAVGQDAFFTVDAFPRKTFKAKITQINYDYRVVDNVITYGVILEVENPELKLRPGMTTNVNINVATKKQSTCIPNKALRINKNILKTIASTQNIGFEEIERVATKKHLETVWVLQNNTFREIPVKLGINDGKYTEVKKGLTTNDLVVIEALDPKRENPVLTMGKLKV